MVLLPRRDRVKLLFTDCGPTLGQCWANGFDVDPLLTQRYVIAGCQFLIMNHTFS